MIPITVSNRLIYSGTFILMLLAMSFSPRTLASNCPALSFVQGENPFAWYRPYVEAANRASLLCPINFSNNFFEASRSVSRVEAAILIEQARILSAFRSSGNFQIPRDNPFPDVPVDGPLTTCTEVNLSAEQQLIAPRAIYQLREQNVLDGEDSGSFAPCRGITREELAKLIVNGFALPRLDQLGVTDYANNLADINAGNPALTDDIKRLVSTFYNDNRFQNEPLPKLDRIATGRIIDTNRVSFERGKIVNFAEMAKLIFNAYRFLQGKLAGRPIIQFQGDANQVVLGRNFDQIISGISNPPSTLVFDDGSSQETLPASTALILEGDAFDLDGDPLFYYWSVDGGAIIPDQSVDPDNPHIIQFLAPLVSQPTIFNLCAIIGDNQGNISQGNFQLTVLPNSDIEQLLGDLAVSQGDIDVDQFNVDPGQTINLRVRVKNEGAAPITVARASFYLSTNGNTFDPSDTRLGSIVETTLQPGSSFFNDLITVNLPTNAPSGDAFILLVADPQDELVEVREDNNVTFTPIRINGQGPDYTITSFTAPSSATAGQSITVSSSMSNIGDSSANSSSRLGYFLSTDAQFDASDRLLGTQSINFIPPGSTLNFSSRPISLPSTVSGSQFLLAVVDYEGRVPEANESNNIRAQTILINGVSSPPTPLANLTLLAHSTISAAIIDQSLRFETRVVNNGQSISNNTLFGIFLTTFPVSNRQDLAGLNPVDTTAIKSLAPGESITRFPSFNVDRNLDINLEYYVTVLLDLNNSVPEGNENDNLQSLPIIITGPDVVVTPDTLNINPTTIEAGGIIQIFSGLTNIGSAAVARDTSTGYFLVDANRFNQTGSFVLDPNVDLFLRSSPDFPSSIAPGQSTDILSKDVTIPSSIAAGDYFIVARADDNRNLFEAQPLGEINNIALTNAPMLRITEANNPPTINGPTTPLRTPEEQSITLTPDKLNALDLDNDPLFIQILAGENYQVQGQNLIPINNFNGVIQAMVQAHDGRALSEPFTLSIIVDPVNDQPIAQADRGLTTQSDQPLLIDVLANDQDIDNDSNELMIQLTTSVSEQGAQLTIINGQVNYQPQGSLLELMPGESVIDRFSYQINDGELSSSTVDVEIRIEGNAIANNGSRRLLLIDQVLGGQNDFFGHQITRLQQPQYLAESPDGLFIYVTNTHGHTISVFRVDLALGRLELVEETPLDQGAGGYALSISQDGQHVYASGINPGRIYGFARNATTGILSLVQVITDPSLNGEARLLLPSFISVSQDDQTVYIADFSANQVLVFNRNIDTGQLALQSTIDGSSEGERSFSGSLSVMETPDGKQLLIAHTDGVLVYDINPVTHERSLQQNLASHNQSNDNYPAIALDNSLAHLYVTRIDRGVQPSILVYQRDIDTGMLNPDPIQVVINDQTALPDTEIVQGLVEPRHLVLSQDQSQVFVSHRSDGANHGGLQVFDRDLSTGLLSFAYHLVDDTVQTDDTALQFISSGASLLASQINHGLVYYTARNANSVSVFDYDSDGDGIADLLENEAIVDEINEPEVNP